MPSLASDQKIWTTLKRNPLTGIFWQSYSSKRASERASERRTQKDGRQPERLKDYPHVENFACPLNDVFEEKIEGLREHWLGLFIVK